MLQYNLCYSGLLLLSLSNFANINYFILLSQHHYEFFTVPGREQDCRHCRVTAVISGKLAIKTRLETVLGRFALKNIYIIIRWRDDVI